MRKTHTLYNINIKKAKWKANTTEKRAVNHYEDIII